MPAKGKAAKKRDPSCVVATAHPGEDRATALARAAIQPTLQAAFTVKQYGKAFGDLDLMGLADSLGAQVEAANQGDLGRAGAMLAVQAHTLDAIFNNLARRAINAEYLDTLEQYLKLALRAQSQCRATLDSLGELKQPRSVAFVRQANIAQGHQQVNNARAREADNLQNELLEKTDGERLDTGAQGSAGGAYSPLAAVGAVDRANDG
jgi:hypothetical protein